MKKTLLFCLLLMNLTAQAQVVVVSGCSMLDGPYYLSGTKPDGRNTYQAGNTIFNCPPCSPQTISFGSGYVGSTPYSGWQLIAGGVEAHNLNQTTPNPPETGWVKKDTYAMCPTNPTLFYPALIESKACTACAWSDPETWVGGVVPTASNHVTVNGDVVLDQNITCYNLTINPGKSLNQTGDREVTVRGKLDNNGFFTAWKLTLNSYILPQTIDGSKFSIQNLSATTGNITLTSDLAVLHTNGSSISNVELNRGNILLGNFNLTCHGVTIGFGSGVRKVVTNGTGALQYQLSGGTFSKDFPIGTAVDQYSAEHYSPVMISGTANTGSSSPVLLSARVADFNTAHAIPDKRNINVEWFLTSSQETLEQPYTVKFGWGAFNPLVPNNFDLNNIYIKRWNGADWENKAGPKSWEWYNGVGYGVTVENVTEFSPWGVFDSEAVLPVKLSAFDVKKEGRTALLEWTTTEEVGSQAFRIEHSLEGSRWQQIMEIPARGESASLARYTYTHGTPANGLNFYRLKMTDFDGSYAYSAIRSLRIDGDDFFIRPNPVTEILYLNSVEGARVQKLSIFNAAGNKVLETSENLTAGVRVSQLPSGIYLVKTSGLNGEGSSWKIVIQH